MSPAGLVASAAVLVAVASGCGRESQAARRVADDERLLVATTVAPITSIVANIVGDRAEVVGIVPEGTNSHTFEPRPSVAELLSSADVVYLNGLQLEEPTRKLAEASARDGAAIIELGGLAISEDEYIFDVAFPRSEGKPNPHLWTNPLLVRRYAAIVMRDMSERDPANADAYAANFAAFSALIDELDAAMRDAFVTIPRRELITYHDAYAYFAADYGWTVLGAIQVSDFGDPTPAEVIDLIEQVRDRQVPAIFGSEVFPSPVLDQIAVETGAEYVDDLRDDDLPGAPGDERHSWLGLMLFDYITITDALGGDSSALRAVDVRNVAPDEAVYPQ